MYTLKKVVQRSTLLGASMALVAASAMPGVVLADALNPLTERSLLLSSSSPGYTNTDGSGNSEDNLNAVGQNYAPPGSGPNGMKTGETFTFNVSTDSSVSPTIKGISLQYCTTAAGVCQAPGDNRGDNRDGTASGAYTGVGPYEDGRETNAQAHPEGRSDLDIVGTFAEASGAVPAAGEFVVLVEGVQSTGWTMTKLNAEDTSHTGDLTGKMNMVHLTNSGSAATPAAGDTVQVIFRPSSTVYITNPGSGSFFVKINTYDVATAASFIPTVPYATNTNIIDGGVTVANVMTDSIHITTKVLETMAFSVGVQNRDTLELTLPDEHGPCDAIQTIDNNRLNLGNVNAEYSLEVERAYDVHSYWRLSSNSSGGAVVYYSGDTLRNTVGDFITPFNSAGATSNPGSEQFGLAFVDDSEMVDELSTSFEGEITGNPLEYSEPSRSPLTAVAAYNGGSGHIGDGTATPIDAVFAFDVNSLTTPVVIASNTLTGGVLSCASAKMRYVGNIAADTPAGVYTTKINYLAAPQY